MYLSDIFCSYYVRLPVCMNDNHSNLVTGNHDEKIIK